MTITTDPLLTRLQACYAGIPRDGMRAAGLRHLTLRPRIRGVDR